MVVGLKWSPPDHCGQEPCIDLLAVVFFLCVYVYSHLLAVHNLLSRCLISLTMCVCGTAKMSHLLAVHIVKMSHLLAILCLTMCVFNVLQRCPIFWQCILSRCLIFWQSVNVCVCVCACVCFFNVLQRCVLHIFAVFVFTNSFVNECNFPHTHADWTKRLT